MTTVTTRIPLTPESIYQVYRGRAGCCCGCRGTHFAGTDLTPRRVANIVRDVATAAPHEVSYAYDEKTREGHYCVKRNDRYGIAYFRASEAA